MQSPNVLLLMTDQHRFDCLGCYGNDVIETPNLDRIASEGTIFRNAYTVCPSCIPARACLITGMSQWNTGILGMGRGQGPMGVGFKHTLPGELAKAGYHTQGVGKMHFHPQRSLNGFHNTILDESGRQKDPGFVSNYKQWFDARKNGDYDIINEKLDWNGWEAEPFHAPEELHPSVWTVGQSIGFLKRRDPSKPFFLKTSFARPHSPYDGPKKYFDMYMERELPEPHIGEWAVMHDDPEEAKKKNAWRGVKTVEEIHRARAGYYANITHIDEQIGRLLTYLEESELLDNTLIIFTSDHGDMLGDHNMWRKTYAYEGSAHIPMIVRMPRDRHHVVHEAETTAMLRDIMPTVLDITEIDIPDTVDGLSMRPVMEEEECDWRPYIHGEHCTCYSEEQEMQYIVDEMYKYIWLPRLDKEQLFDLQDDPGEIVDLSKNPDYSDILQGYRKKLVTELEPRDADLTKNGGLVPQKGRSPIVSPKYEERLKRCGFDWLSYGK